MINSKSTARTDEGSYNGTNNFLEWYKENYGTDYDHSVGFVRREGMNDGVWNVGMNLYNYYLQGLDDGSNRASEEANRNTYYDKQLETLLGKYSASREALDKSKRQSQQNASITLDKLKKYLPTQIKAQGLGGLGVSESTMLQAYNNYNNDMGAIESDYQANKTALDTGETSAKNTLENYRQDALQKIADKYSAAAAARQAEAGSTSKDIFSAYQAQIEAKQQTDRENALNAVRDAIAAYEVDEDYEGALKYLEQNKDTFGADSKEYQSYWNRISGKAEKYKTDKETAEKEEKDKRIITGQEYVSYDGAQYQIKSQLDMNANEIRDNESFTKKLKSLGFTNPYDQNIPNGTSFEINCDAYGSDKVDWQDFVGWLLGPVNIAINHSVYKKTVTYYNGNWYISEKK